MFIDLDLRGEPLSVAQTTLRRMRELPHELFFDCRTLLVRFPDELQAAGTTTQERNAVYAELYDLLAELNTELAIDATVTRILRFHSAEDDDTAAGLDIGVSVPDGDELLGRARAAEFGALLRRGNGLWKPTTYHYRLPSGRHASTFVRLANAFREPRDTYALGTWLAADIPRKAGVLMDTAGLTPLIQAFQELQRAAGGEPGPVTSMATYPTTQFDMDRAVRALSAFRPLRAVLSVSSSGDVLDRIIRAAGSYADSGWGVDVLIARDRAAGELISPIGDSRGIPADRPDRSIGIWTSLRDAGAAAGEACQLCADERTARLVQVDPHSFEGLILPEPRLLMPSIQDAAENLRLWEIADATGAAHIQSKPDNWRSTLRPLGADRNSRMSLRIDLTELIASPALVAGVARKLAFPRTAADGTRAIIAEEIRGARIPGCKDFVAPDLILVDVFDQNRRNFVPIVEAVSAAVGATLICAADPGKNVEDWGDNTKEAILDARHILIFTLGSVSGYGLQRMLLGVQEHRRRGDNFVISGLAMHGRPNSDRQWQTLHNSYGRRLWTVWKSLLPNWSPFDDEAELFDNLDNANSDPEVQAFLNKRVDICKGQLAPLDAERAEGRDGDYPTEAKARYLPLLWGMPQQYQHSARIRQMSIFGHQLGIETLHMAVASSVQQARDPGPTPGSAEWSLFEMPAILRSYYDPLIIATMLRWLRPGELWWGTNSESGTRAIEELLARTPESDRKVLLPELLLSASMGKLSRDGAELILAVTEAVLAQGRTQAWSEEELVPLRAAVHVWRSHTAPRISAAVGFQPETSSYRVLVHEDEQRAEHILAGLRHVPGMETVLHRLADRGHLKFGEQLLFLLAPHPAIDDKSPLSLLLSYPENTFAERQQEVLGLTDAHRPHEPTDPKGRSGHS